MDIITPLTHDEVFCNFRVKINPRTGEVMEAVAASKNVFRAVAVEARPGRTDRRRKPQGWETWEAEEASAALGDYWEAERRLNLFRGARRARKALFETAACNPFDCFFTFTLDPRKVQRYDYRECVRVWNRWADNRVRRHGLRYVAVPEEHKDGAIHFHGLCNAKALELVEGMRIDNCKKVVFNTPSWSYGFSAVLALSGTYEAACNYVAKYIVKQVQTRGGTIGGRYWFHGGDLAGPVVKYGRVDFEAVEGPLFEIVDAGLQLKYLQGKEVEEWLERALNG